MFKQKRAKREYLTNSLGVGGRGTELHKYSFLGVLVSGSRYPSNYTLKALVLGPETLGFTA